MRALLLTIAQSNSKNEDTRRQEFILNILLFGIIFLSGISLISTAVAQIQQLINGQTSEGIVSSVFILAFLLVFILLYFLSKKGFSRLVSYIFVFIFLIPTIYGTFVWGTELPQGLLDYALIIIISCILIGTGFAWVLSVFISGIILITTLLQVYHFNSPNFYWKTNPIEVFDGVVFAVTFSVIMLVSWLSNREIEKSLKRARKSEAELKKERDLLEVRIEERTRELKIAQQEKITQLNRFAEFGRLASGIFHDLSNPLMAISLNLEAVNKNKLEAAKPNIDRALKATKKVEEFVHAVRKQIQQQETKQIFSLKNEISEATQILNYKAIKNKVEIKFNPSRNVKLFGNPLKFIQIITNLISNAIDSYEGMKKEEKRVEIKLEEINNFITICIQDFGKGIEEESLDKIFDPFFTTKNVSSGVGIGLSIVKNIIEDDFKGRIELESKINEGTKFIIRIPNGKAS